jgi:phage tail-like protein
VPTISGDDPLRSYRFRVELTGVTAGGAAVGGFSEVTGLEVTSERVDYREGDERSHARKLPGIGQYAPITLKRGLIRDSELWSWIQEGMQGNVRRADVSIVLMDETGRREVMRWKCVRAWPGKWTGPGMNAKSGEVAIETLEISYEGLEVGG